MNEIIRIEDVEIERVLYRDQPVLTLPEIDRVHGRPEGTAKRNFNQHRERFLLGKDYHELPYEEWSVLSVRNSYAQGGDSYAQKDAGGFRGSMVFLTLYGYLMLVKSFTDDRAWYVQRLLVDSYFNLKAIQKEAEKDAAYVELKDRYISLIEKHVALLERKTVKRIRLTEEEIKTILDLHAAGVSGGEIVRRTGRPKSTVSNIINYGVTSGRRTKDE